MNKERKILKVIYDNPNITREEISKKSGINLFSVYTIVKDLLNKKILIENGYEKSTGGRRRSLISINPELGLVAGFTLEHTYICGVLCNLIGEVKKKKVINIEPDIRKNKVIEKLIQCIDEITQKDKEKIWGIGIGSAGLIDKKRERIMKNVHIKDFENVPIKRIIEERYKIPTYLEQKNAVAAFCEYKIGKGKNYSNLIYFNIDIGVGVGLVINGEIYKGFYGFGGEFGHTIISDNGRVCICGNRGCIESFISIPSIISQIRELLEEGVISEINNMIKDYKELDWEIIYKAAKNKDKLTLNILNEVGKYIGRSIINLFNLLDPGIIIIGGRIKKMKEFIVDSIQKEIDEKKWFFGKVNFDFSEMDEEIQAVGAGLYAVNEIFKNIKL